VTFSKRITLFSRTRFSLLATLFFLTSSLLPAAEIGKWIEQMGASDREQRREASYQLLQLGPAAKPALAELIKALDDPDKQVWSNSISAIAAIGPGAVDAVPKLLEAMESRRGRNFGRRDRSQGLVRAAYALTRIGDGAKPQLFAALKSDDTGLRTGAAKALGGMGAAAKDAIPALIENLGHSDPDLRSEVVEALGLIGPEAVAPLADSLGWPDARLREGSARALASIGPAAAPSGPKLLERLDKDSESSVRIAVLSALPKVGLPQEKVVPPLVAALKSNEEAQQHAAINSLLLIRPAGKVAVPALATLLSDPAQAERAAYVLGRFGTEAKSTVPALLSAAQRTQPPAAAYTDALAQIGAPAVPGLLAQIEKLPPASLNRTHWAVQTLKAIGSAAVPDLQKALVSPNATVRLAALSTLNELGPDAREARADVLKLAGDPEPLVRATLLSAVVSLDASTPRALEKIEAGTRDKEPVVRAAAATAAASLGAGARPISNQIAALLDDPDSTVRGAAFKAAASLGGDDPKLVEKLLTWLDDPPAHGAVIDVKNSGAGKRLVDPALRIAAIEALARMGSSAATPRLIELYPKSDQPTRLAILAAFGAGGDAALPSLDAAARDTDPAIRAAALRALAKAQKNTDTLVASLTVGLGDGDGTVRRAAVESLTPLGERSPDKAAPALPALIGLVANDSDRTFALEALRALRVRDVGAITIALDSPSPEARQWACERAARLGGPGRALKPKLEAMLNSSNDYDRRAARRALEQLNK
jgi:HEAT repeat protein